MTVGDALDLWMRETAATHPLHPFLTDPDPARQLAVEALLHTLEARGGERWRHKRERDFRPLTSFTKLLDLRAELLVARALQDGEVAFTLGDTSRPNPDFILTELRLGVEVTSLNPPGITELEQAANAVAADHPGITVDFTFSAYPSRLLPPLVEELIEQMRGAAERLTQTNEAQVVQYRLDDPKNARAITVTTVVDRADPFGAVRWQTEAGDLASPMGSAEYAVFQAGQSPAKAAQARAVAGGTILAVDISRHGSAWMRPARIWAGLLAERFPADFPFVAVAVLRQDLHEAHAVEPAVALSPCADQDTRRRVQELCDAIRWPCDTRRPDDTAAS